MSNPWRRGSGATVNPDITIGHRQVRPRRNTREGEGRRVHLAPEAMAVLVCLSQVRGGVC